MARVIRSSALLTDHYELTMLQAALRGGTAQVSALSGDGFDEETFHAHLEASQVPLARYWYYIFVAKVRYLGGDHAGAHAMAKHMETHRSP